MSLRFAISLALLPLVTACGGGGGAQPKVQSASSKPALTIPRAPTRSAPPSARVQSAPGLEGVIGATPAELARQFGTARLDVWEGDARKLQFAGDACLPILEAGRYFCQKNITIGEVCIARDDFTERPGFRWLEPDAPLV